MRRGCRRGLGRRVGGLICRLWVLRGSAVRDDTIDPIPWISGANDGLDFGTKMYNETRTDGGRSRRHAQFC